MLELMSLSASSLSKPRLLALAVDTEGTNLPGSPTETPAPRRPASATSPSCLVRTRAPALSPSAPPLSPSRGLLPSLMTRPRLGRPSRLSTESPRRAPWRLRVGAASSNTAAPGATRMGAPATDNERRSTENVVRQFHTVVRLPDADVYLHRREFFPVLVVVV